MEDWTLIMNVVLVVFSTLPLFFFLCFLMFIKFQIFVFIFDGLYISQVQCNCISHNDRSNAVFFKKINIFIHKEWHYMAQMMYFCYIKNKFIPVFYLHFIVVLFNNQSAAMLFLITVFCNIVYTSIIWDLSHQILVKEI